MACVLPDLKELDCEENNLGGIQGDIYFIPKADIDTAALPAINDDGVTLVGVIQPKVGKKFSVVYQTAGKGKLEDNTVGERDSKSAENIVEFSHPGTGKSLTQFKKQIQNLPLVVIVKEGGKFRVLGITVFSTETAPGVFTEAVSLDLPAYIETASGTTGTATADYKGTIFNIKAESTRAALYYEDAIIVIPVV